MKPLTVCLLGVAITVGLTTHAQAAWQCPATSQTHPLTVFSLYPGDPAEVSNVIPDSNRKDRDGSYTGLWKLDPAEHLIAVCSYKGGADKQIKLPVRLKECRTAGKPPSFRANCD